MATQSWLGRAIVLSSMVGVLACSGGTTEVEVEPDAAEAADDEEEEVGAPVAVVAGMRAMGPPGRVPREVGIRLGEAVYPADHVGRPVPAVTKWSIEPEIAGELRIVATDELAFVPATSFAPNTEYRFGLEAVGSENYPAATPAPGEDWSVSFSTPAFELVRASTWRHDVTAMKAEIDLVFSGPVSAEELPGKVSFAVDGRKVTAAEIRQGPDSDTVRVTFLGRAFASSGSLEVSLAKGVPHREAKGVTAPAGDAKVSLKVGGPVEMHAVLVKEGGTGFYVDVICSDPGAGSERYYWDPDTYDGWYVTSRCQPDADLALSSIHVTPAVDFTVAASPGGFRLFGDFQPGRTELTFDAGLQMVDGGVLKESFTQKLRIPNRTPRVNFTSKGRYLPRSAWRELPVQHVNVNMFDLTVRHVPPENLVFWLTGEERPSRSTSNVIYTTEMWAQGKKNETATSWLDMRDMLPDVGRGVYEIEVSDPKSRAVDASRILLTDLQLVAKLAAPQPGSDWSNKAHVWVRDVHSIQGVSGAEVSMVRRSGQVMGRCRTDGEGGCVIDIPEDPVDSSPPFALLARKGDDLTYLALDELRVSPEDDVSGVSWTVADDGPPYRAAVYSDRGVYRPGDVAHVAAVLRAEDFRAPKAGVPVRFELRDPSGTKMRREVVEADENGLVSIDLPFHDFATTGSWSVSLSVGDSWVGSLGLSVEEFVPERMKATAQATEGRHLTSDPVPVEVAARWLFGGSAKGSRVEMRCRLAPGAFTPPGLKGWHVGLAEVGEGAPTPLMLGDVEGVLNDEGEATLACPEADASAARFGSARLLADVSVFEGQSGRTTDVRVSTPVHPAPIYIATRASTDRAEANVPVELEGRVVTPEGRPAGAAAPAELELEVVRLDEEYGWWWDEDEGQSSYRRLLRRSVVERTTVKVADGRFAHRWMPGEDAAGYLLVLTGEGARTEHYLEGAGRRFLWSPRDSSVDQTPRPRRPTPLAVSVPESVEVGDSVPVSVEVPYSGHLLWTVESHDVLVSEWVKVEPGTVAWSFPVEAFSPNVYVGAFLVKDPHLESAEAYLPDRGFGVASVTIRPSRFLRDVEVQVPEEVRPYSTVDVTVDVGPVDKPVTATVALVDEGILQLTRFETPDPSKDIFAKRRLAVSTFETVGWSLLSEPRGPSSSTGGDSAGASGRVQMVKPVALWSGPVTIPTSGKVTVPFDIPGYRGELRAMVVVAGPDRMGHADKAVTVRDPLVLQTTLPRFLTDGDVAQIPVMVTNMSGADRTVSVRLRAEGFDPFDGKVPGPAVPDQPVSFVGGDKAELKLTKGEGGTVVFRVRADFAPAAVRFEVQAEAGSLLSVEKLELPVVPSTPTDRRLTRQPLSGDVDVDAMLASGGWAEGADTTTLWVTANPYAPALVHLTHLVKYPYGCIEQTSSATRPLLYVRDLVEQIDASLVESGSVDDMVQAGVDRVLSMQTPVGGFSYWPGGRSPDDWGTAYGLHLLLDAREAGHEVPSDAITDAVDWLAGKVDGASDRQSSTTLAYQHYVLAKAGQGRPASALEVLGRVQNAQTSTGLSRWERARADEASFLLQAAIFLGGDRRFESQLRKVAFSATASGRANDRSYYSDARRRALKLDVLEDLFPGLVANEPLAMAISKNLSQQSSRYYTTQELAWGISALGKRVKSLGGKVPRVALTAGGQALKPVGGKGEPSWTLRGATGIDDLVLDVKGDATGSWLVTTVDGARATDDLAVGGSSVKVTRTWLSDTGAPLDLAKHTLGDRIYVRIDVTNTTRVAINNLAIVDRLPAGWEIENPRMGGDAMPEWVNRSEVFGADHMNVRDDRIELFGGLRAQQTRSVVYAVRAVTAGTFWAHDVTVEAMYDPSVWARQRGDEITILGPWAGSFL